MNYFLITGLIFFISFLINNTLKNKFKKYSLLNLKINMSGKEIAEKMLKDNNINDVKIISIEDELSDHYNLINKTINLSKKIYNDRNIISAAVSAHECGHAIQHKLGYSMLRLRSQLIPLLNISSRFVNIIIMTGLITYYSSGNSLLIKIGISLFSIASIFSFITLPIEFNASYQALNWLKSKNIVDKQEYNNSKNALQWAAMTYVIAALGSLTQLMYFISLLNRDND